jgi:hypothetical protein
MTMINKYSLHFNAINRLKDRFNVEAAWLLNELEHGRFVRLKGLGNSDDVKQIYSGNLIYIPDKNDYCIIIIDDRLRLVITVFTQIMVLNTPWGKGLDETEKLKAKKISLIAGVDINDINFFRLYAEERKGLLVTVIARALSYDWRLKMIKICKIKLDAYQIDPVTKFCTLTENQVSEVSLSIYKKIDEKKIQPYCDLILKSSDEKTALISNKIDGIFFLEDSVNLQRWNLLD